MAAFLEQLVRHVPHIKVGNDRLASWWDIKRSLFPGCTGANCYIVLNCLKVRLKYPLLKPNIRKCSSVEQSKFLESFLCVSLGEVLVNLKEIGRDWDCLLEMVLRKHDITKDTSSQACNARVLCLALDDMNFHRYDSCMQHQPSAVTFSKQIIWNIPHITIRGNPVASWSDVREVLFPSCVGRDCTIVLSCLQLILTYPLMAQDVFTCTDDEWSKFLSNFQSVHKGDTLVNLQQISRHWQRLVEMVVQKHYVSKDISSSDCAFKTSVPTSVVGAVKAFHGNTDCQPRNIRALSSRDRNYSIDLLSFPAANGMLDYLPGLVITNQHGQREAYVPIVRLINMFPNMQSTIRNILKQQIVVRRLLSRIGQEDNNNNNNNNYQQVMFCPRKYACMMSLLLVQNNCFGTYITSQTMLLNWSFFIKVLYVWPSILRGIPLTEHHLSQKNHTEVTSQSQTSKPDGRSDNTIQSSTVVNYQLLLWEYQKRRQRKLLIANGTGTISWDMSTLLTTTERCCNLKNGIDHLSAAQMAKHRRNMPGRSSVSLNRMKAKEINSAPVRGPKPSPTTDNQSICYVNGGGEKTMADPHKQKKQSKSILKDKSIGKRKRKACNVHFSLGSVNSGPSLVSNVTAPSDVHSRNTVNGAAKITVVYDESVNDRKGELLDVTVDEVKKTVSKGHVLRSDVHAAAAVVVSGRKNMINSCKLPVSKSRIRNRNVYVNNDILSHSTTVDAKLNQNEIISSNGARLKLHNKENIGMESNKEEKEEPTVGVSSESSHRGSGDCSQLNLCSLNVGWKNVYPVHGSLIKAKPIKKNILTRELLKEDIGLLREISKLVCTCRDVYRPTDKSPPPPLRRYLQEKFNANSSHCSVHSAVVVVTAAAAAATTKRPIQQQQQQ